MYQSSSNVIGSEMGGTSVQIYLSNAFPKYGGSNDYLIIGDYIDERVYAVWYNGI